MMAIDTRFRNDVLIATATGRIDGSNVRDFEAALQSAVRGRKCPIVIDCRELFFLSSIGLRAILLIARSQKARDASFALCSMSAPLARTLRKTGISRIISTYATLQEALGAVRVERGSNPFGMTTG